RGLNQPCCVNRRWGHPAGVHPSCPNYRPVVNLVHLSCQATLRTRSSSRNRWLIYLDHRASRWLTQPSHCPRWLGLYGMDRAARSWNLPTCSADFPNPTYSADWPNLLNPNRTFVGPFRSSLAAPRSPALATHRSPASRARRHLAWQTSIGSQSPW